MEHTVSCWGKLPLKTTEEDHEEEAAVSLADAKHVSMDAAVV